MAQFKRWIQLGTILVLIGHSIHELQADESCTPQPLHGAIVDQSQAWQDLLLHLHQVETVSAVFHETRIFPMRKHPVTIDGEVRFSREHGLSLLYSNSKRQIIVDKLGMLMRTESGKGSALPDEAGAVPETLLALFHFDWEKLQELFLMEGCVEANGVWKLRLVPREDTTRKAIRGIRISGVHQTVDTIVLEQTSSQRVELAMTAHQFNQGFSPAELERYFR